MPDEILASATRYLRDSLGFLLKEHEEINGGMTNRLFHLKSDDAKSVILKWYYDDGNNRLQREFDALSFLQLQGFANVPIAYFKNDKLGYAIYSFMPGNTLPFRDEQIQNVTHAYLDQMVDFIASLHRIKRDKDSERFTNATGAQFSLSGYMHSIEIDLQRAKHLPPNFAHDVDINAHLDISGAINLIQQRLKIIASRRTKLDQLDRADMRLSPVDFGSQNILVEGEAASFIDFEDFGWDDPMQIVAYPTPALAPKYKNYFMAQYLRQSPLPVQITERLPIIVELRELAWAARLLLGLTADVIEKRRFATVDFDTATYIVNQCERINIHLSSL